MLRLLVVEANDFATVRAALCVGALDAIMAGSSDAKVRRIDVVRNIETVILLVPMAGAAFDA